MKIMMTGHHIDITPALRAYVTEKLERVSRHFDHIITATFVLSVEKLDQIAEGSLTVAGGGKALFATDTAEDLYAAIDGLMDKLDRQIRRHKEKLTDHHRSESYAVNG